MAVDRKGPETEFFWGLAEGLLARPGIEEGTLMGFPCLRAAGNFFCTCDHRSGDLIVKLSRERVLELIEAGEGEPFAPAGRVFKQWVLVPERDRTRWTALMEEALALAAG